MKQGWADAAIAALRDRKESTADTAAQSLKRTTGQALGLWATVSPTHRGSTAAPDSSGRLDIDLKSGPELV